MSHNSNFLTTVGSIAKDTIQSGYSEWNKLGVTGKTKVAAITGGVAGLALSDRDGIGDSLVDTAIGAGVGVGVGKATDYIVKNHGERIAEEAIKFKNDIIDVGKIAKEKSRIDAEKMLEEKVEMKKVKNNLTKMKVAGAIGLTAFAAASVIDTNKEAQQDIRVSRMKEEQEKNLARQKQQEDKTMKQFQFGGPSDMGSIVLDMYNQRIGHHLMGNAKFQ